MELSAEGQVRAWAIWSLIYEVSPIWQEFGRCYMVRVVLVGDDVGVVTRANGVVCGPERVYRFPSVWLHYTDEMIKGELLKLRAGELRDLGVDGCLGLKEVGLAFFKSPVVDLGLGEDAELDDDAHPLWHRLINP